MATRVPMLVIVAIPQEAFRVWLKQLLLSLDITLPADTPEPDVIDLYLDSPLFLIPPQPDAEALNQYIQDHYKTIFINNLYLWCQDSDLWPKEFANNFTYEEFSKFFKLEIHSRLYNFPLNAKVT